MLASIAQDEQVSTWLLPQDFSLSGVKANLFFAHGGRFCWLETFQKKKKKTTVNPAACRQYWRSTEWQLYLEYTG